MRSCQRWCLGFLLLPGLAHGAEPPGRLVQDIWNAAYLDGSKGGYVHTSVRQVERDGQTLYDVTTRLNLTIKRNDAKILLRMDTGDEETVQGKVMRTWMRQYQGDRQQLCLIGTVKAGQLEVTVEGMARQEKKVPWNDEVVGAYRQEQLFREHKVRPGDQFTFLGYEAIINRVVANRVVVKDFEEIEVFKVPQRLLRVETLPEKVFGVPLPGLITWLDKEWRPVRSQFDIPQLGTLVLYRCSKEEATRPDESRIDIAKTSLIPLNRAIDWPNQTRSAVYRITVREDDDPTSTFARDNRQEWRNLQGNTFELHVHATRPPQAAVSAGPVKDEFLKSCYWIDSDDSRIKAYTQRAVARRTDPWEQAKAIERWVHENMRLSYSESFAPASEVAKTLRGDCRQYGLLTTAMCRAIGLPARTALGLCYAFDRQQGPVMAFHMWTEVFVRGEWVAIDPTRGEGHVGATHLKIADSSWYDTQSLTPLLPVFRVLGKLSIEVVRINSAD